MKARQLHEKLGRILARMHEDEDLDVVVRTHDGGIGPTPAVGARSITPGFDWDSGRLMIHPEEELVRKKNLKD